MYRPHTILESKSQSADPAIRQYLPPLSIENHSSANDRPNQTPPSSHYATLPPRHWSSPPNRHLTDDSPSHSQITPLTPLRQIRPMLLTRPLPDTASLTPSQTPLLPIIRRILPIGQPLQIIQPPPLKRINGLIERPVTALVDFPATVS